MDARALRFLTGDAGRAVLEQLAAADLSDAQTLPLLTGLRRHLPPATASAALTLARLRVRAATKFARAGAMFFTPDSLEQASGEVVSAWRARYFAEYVRSGAPIADLGCGIGGDTLALAALPGATVIAVDREPLRLMMARANLAAYGAGAHVVRADLTDPLPACGVAAAFFDPARRLDGRRIFSVRDTRPPLDIIDTWHFRALAVKLSPGVALDELRPWTERGAGVEFISVGGDLKEALLRLGGFGFAGRQATRLDPGGIRVLAPRNLPAPPLSAPRAYLLEPDPAVIRAGLFGEVADDSGSALYRLDETIAYLTGDAQIESPWLRAWPVRAWMLFNLKKLRAALRARGIGRVTVKKRGSPLTPEELIRKLKLDGDGESAVVVLTQVAQQPAAIICGEMIP